VTRPRPERFDQRRRRHDRALGSFLIASAVVATLIASYVTWTRVELMRDGIEVTGQLSAVDDDYLDPTYEYVVDDQTYSYDPPDSGSVTTDPDVTVTLLVDPDHPSRAASRGFRDLLGPAAIAWGAAAALALLGVLLRSRFARFRHTWADGTILRDDLGTAGAPESSAAADDDERRPGATEPGGDSMFR
jgi:hypothetical protein